MKKIIKGRLYNTETAKYVANYSWGGPSDFHHVDEDLYRKQTGEFFLHGEGGTLSKYRSPVDGGGWTSGEDIIPMSDLDAQEWIEAHCDVDTYVKLFGDVKE